MLIKFWSGKLPRDCFRAGLVVCRLSPNRTLVWKFGVLRFATKKLKTLSYCKIVIFSRCVTIIYCLLAFGGCCEIVPRADLYPIRFQRFDRTEDSHSDDSDVIRKISICWSSSWVSYYWSGKGSNWPGEFISSSTLRVLFQYSLPIENLKVHCGHPICLAGWKQWHVCLARLAE